MTQGEVYALVNALESYEFRKAMEAFFNEEAENARKRCAEASFSGMDHSATVAAVQANCCDEMLNRLMQFADASLKKA